MCIVYVSFEVEFGKFTCVSCHHKQLNDISTFNLKKEENEYFFILCAVATPRAFNVIVFLASHEAFYWYWYIYLFIFHIVRHDMVMFHRFFPHSPKWKSVA